jgi:hypothetical protein
MLFCACSRNCASLVVYPTAIVEVNNAGFMQPGGQSEADRRCDGALCCLDRDVGVVGDSGSNVADNRCWTRS